MNYYSIQCLIYNNWIPKLCVCLYFFEHTCERHSQVLEKEKKTNISISCNAAAATHLSVKFPSSKKFVVSCSCVRPPSCMSFVCRKERKAVKKSELTAEKQQYNDKNIVGCHCQVCYFSYVLFLKDKKRQTLKTNSLDANAVWQKHEDNHKQLDKESLSDH